MSRVLLSLDAIPNVTPLPVTARHGELIWTDLNFGNGGVTSALMMFDIRIGGVGAWLDMGQAIAAVHGVIPTNMAAAVGWRLPAGGPSIVVPYVGSYSWDIWAEFVGGTADPILGVGAAPSSLAATGSPPVAGFAGSTGAASFRTQPSSPPGGGRVNTAGSTAADLTFTGRCYSSGSTAISFGRMYLSCRAAYCYGTA